MLGRLPWQRLCFVFAATVAVTLGTASTGWTQAVRAAGGVKVFDETGCPGGGNAAKVAVPFSILATGLEPFSQTAELFITDKDVTPEVQYGPIPIEHVDASGQACANVLEANPGSWKVDVLEQGSGFTDSKVITVEGPMEPPTTASSTSTSTSLPPTSTTPAPPTSTTTTSSTTASSTTTSSTTTSTTTSPTTAPPTATSTTVPLTTTMTSPETVQRPGSELPWTIVWVAALNTALPRTGGDALAACVVGVGLVGLGVPLLFTRRRR